MAHNSYRGQCELAIGPWEGGDGGGRAVNKTHAIARARLGPHLSCFDACTVCTPQSILHVQKYPDFGPKILTIFQNSITPEPLIAEICMTTQIIANEMYFTKKD